MILAECDGARDAETAVKCAHRPPTRPENCYRPSTRRSANAASVRVGCRASGSNPAARDASPRTRNQTGSPGKCQPSIDRDLARFTGTHAAPQGAAKPLLHRCVSQSSVQQTISVSRTTLVQWLAAFQSVKLRPTKISAAHVRLVIRGATVKRKDRAWRYSKPREQKLHRARLALLDYSYSN